MICVSNGNSKLGSIPNISLIPGKDCGDVPCKAQCYALKAWKQYPETRAAWKRNSRTAHDNGLARHRNRDNSRDTSRI